MTLLDKELRREDIQALNSADSVSAFFSLLGYNTDTRLVQTPTNLGISSQDLTRQIRRIELLADQEGLLQVYLSELTSVTLSAARALCRSFRNRAGNYLLIVTSDYERIDFVLVEKAVPVGAVKGIGQKQVEVRPRILTVERRKPDRVHLRVLRRFTYTESDPIAQYYKLLSAYSIADWSEEFFNNRALFSDYYLMERLRETEEWKEDPKPAYRQFQKLYDRAATRLSGKGEEDLRQSLLIPAFEVLGFTPKEGKAAKEDVSEPDYRLSADGKNGELLAVCLAYPWGRSLDGKDDQRDKDSPEENPEWRVVSLLKKGETEWAIVTNGKLWRLYSAKTHSRATNYYEIDLEEALAEIGPQAGDPGESFRYFWLLFRREALAPIEVDREGRKRKSSFLNELFEESEDYAKRLGARLKDRVFKKIFPQLPKGFVEFIQQREGRNVVPPQERLDRIYEGTLTFLYRLLFLLYAEARDLLPVKEARGYWEKSLTRMKNEVAENAGKIEDEVGNHLAKCYRKDYTTCTRGCLDSFR